MKYDVVIFGGGTSGCACAWNCAKLGLKTLLVEKNNFLGGLMTGGLVIPMMKSAVNEENSDYYRALLECAKKYNAQITYSDKNTGWFNPEMMKIVLDEVLESAGVEVLFESIPTNVVVNQKKIESVEILSGILSLHIKSKYFVDATAQGSLSNLADCEFLEDNEVRQQNSLRFILGNVNVEKFCEFIKSVDKDENITNTYRDDTNTYGELHFTTASTWDTSTKWAMDKILQKGIKDGILNDTDRSYFQVFSVARGLGQVAFNCPRMENKNDNPLEASKMLIEARRAIYRLYTFSKKYFPGFENAIITNIAALTGVREYRRLKTKYIYKTEDLTSGKTFKNTVLSANYSIDIHSDKKDGSILKKTSTYHLPIEALMSADIDNLFCSGMLVGAEFMAHSALRVQRSALSMGEGVAKYIKGLV